MTRRRGRWSIRSHLYRSDLTVAFFFFFYAVPCLIKPQNFGGNEARPADQIHRQRRTLRRRFLRNSRNRHRFFSANTESRGTWRRANPRYRRRSFFSPGSARNRPISEALGAWRANDRIPRARPLNANPRPLPARHRIKVDFLLLFFFLIAFVNLKRKRGNSFVGGAVVIFDVYYTNVTERYSFVVCTGRARIPVACSTLKRRPRFVIFGSRIRVFLFRPRSGRANTIFFGALARKQIICRHRY